MPIPKGQTPATRIVLADVLLDRLTDEIVAGTRQPGSALGENVVAADNGVSATPAREALNRLAEMGLVVNTPGRGTVVAPLDRRRFRDTVRTLSPVLIETFRLITPIADDADRAWVTGALDGSDFFTRDGLGHRSISVLGDPRITRAWNSLVPYLRRALVLDPATEVPGPDAGARAALSSAIRGGDADAAASIIERWCEAVTAAAPAPDDSYAAAVPPERARLGKRATMQEHAYQTIYRAIYDGTLVPGEELRDDDLEQWLAMSRHPIRQALLRLAEYDLVEITLGRVPRVAPLDPARTNHALLLSSMFNEYGVLHATAHLDEGEASRVASLATTIEETAAAGDFAELALALDAYFSVFTTALDNEVLEEQKRRIVTELALLLTPGASVVDVGRIPPRIRAITDAVQRRDAIEALRLTRDFYEPTRTNFVEHFRRR